jgi:hypothetical protein
VVTAAASELGAVRAYDERRTSWPRDAALPTPGGRALARTALRSLVA